MKTAVVTGITGQDGAYMAKHLLGQGYRVIGTHRQGVKPNLWRAAELGIDSHAQLSVIPIDVTDLSACRRLLESTEASEIYNYAGQSISVDSTNDPDTAARVNGLGPINFLNAIRDVNPEVRFCQASSAEMFGAPLQSPQNESTPFTPRTFYGLAKLHAHRAIETYRAEYGVFGCSAIMFNHESPLRSTEFITRKITHGMVRIKLGLQDALEVGNLDHERDWSFAGDFADSMQRMMTAKTSDSYVLASGRMTTVRRFAELAASAAGLSLAWTGHGDEERGIETTSGKWIVKLNRAFARTPESARMCGDSGKAERQLGWKATTPVESLCKMMVEADLKRCTRAGAAG
jgi:GDPmannose 4,6-dehydratase